MPLSNPTRIAICWLIHLLTASGLVIGLGAILAIAHHEFEKALMLIMLTIIVDGLDGPLARLFNVKKFAPEIDGTLLDNIVDFFTWVILPCYFIIEAKLLAPSYAFWACSAILLCSAYQFCCSDVKSCASTFKRWPSAWSLVIIFMFIWQSSEALNLFAIAGFVVLSLIPIYYVHPFQKNDLLGSTFVQNLLRLSAAVFTLSMVYAIYSFPDQAKWLTYFQQAGIMFYFGLCLYQTKLVAAQPE